MSGVQKHTMDLLHQAMENAIKVINETRKTNRKKHTILTKTIMGYLPLQNIGIQFETNVMHSQRI